MKLYKYSNDLFVLDLELSTNNVQTKFLLLTTNDVQTIVHTPNELNEYPIESEIFSFVENILSVNKSDKVILAYSLIQKLVTNS